MNKKTKVQAYKVMLTCDKCGRDMKRTGKVLMVYPQRYEYKCECGEVETSTEMYPKIEYERCE